MKYLYDNGFNVITLVDLGYDDYQERFYVNDVSNNNIPKKMTVRY
jgi:hypothetical protein